MMRIGEKWRCESPDCGVEVVVLTVGSSTTSAGPRCGCGSRMKRRYEKPVVRALFRSANEFKQLQGAQPTPQTPEGVPVQLGERRRR